MVEGVEITLIQDLKKRWIRASLATTVVWTVAVALIAGQLLLLAGISIWWNIAVVLVTLSIASVIERWWSVREDDISQFLNSKYPELEESAGLALKASDSLSLLERLQLKKISPHLAEISWPSPLKQKIVLSAICLICCIGISFALSHFAGSQREILIAKPGQPDASNPKPAKEKVLPTVSGLVLIITPPSYTGRPVHQQKEFNVVAEEGATLNWDLNTTSPASQIIMIFNDSIQIALKPSDNSKTAWKTSRQISTTGFYQVNIDGNISELYKVEMIKDQAPVVTIESPKQYTTVDFGDPQKINTVLKISDDYGIHNAFITATIANGSGEAVKFKEQKILIPGFAPGRRDYQLKKVLSLKELGMQPGDELYFYVDAFDTHNQETRSDVYIINIADTAQLMSLDGLTFGVSLKPEYFRSERQIIIETEQLIKNRAVMNVDSFKTKSNDLGIDQKLLRLRYGKFLGEESSSDIPGAEGSGRDVLSDPSNFGNAAVVLDQFTDKHDNSEDATFFEPAIKEQLKATLTEMWNAELQLRTFKPEDALPYEYKALRLLKDLQQKSRAYVAKTSFKTASLKPEKRLTGDLSKITEPVTRRAADRSDESAADLQKAIGLLGAILQENEQDNVDLQALDKASGQLNRKAASDPVKYLGAAQAFRNVLGSIRGHHVPQPAEVMQAQAGLQRLAETPPQLPNAGSVNQDALSRSYFSNLSRRAAKS